MSPEPTQLESRLITFIQESLEQQAGIPSFEEIRRGLNLSSKDHVSRLIDSLVDKGFLRRQPNRSRSLVLLRLSDGRPFRLAHTVFVPLLAVAPASFDRPVFDGFGPDNFLELSRDLVPDETGIYAMQVRGDSMTDAFINDGDIVVLRQQQEAHNGDLVQVWVRPDESITLKRFFRDGSRIRLQPENAEIRPRFFAPEDIRVQGKVMLVIRRIQPALAA